MINYHQPGARRILELPIYRCKEEQYFKEQEDKFEAEVNSIQQSYRSCGATIPYITKADKDQFKLEWYKRNVCLWDFNQIVGWIRLYAWTGKYSCIFILYQPKNYKNYAPQAI